VPARPDKGAGRAPPGRVSGGYGGLVKDLGSERYVSITSFRRDGTAVATPAIMLAERISKMLRRRPGQPEARVYLELTLAAT
jgi:hypothetical protein